MENKYSKPNTTRKKVKFLGTKEFIDASTGEKETMQVTNIEERDANFHKIWLGHMLESLDMIGNQKIRVAMFIMENINKENELIMTYRVIADKTNTSLQTASGTMQALQGSNLLSKIRNGYYRVNPDVIFKGGRNDQINLSLRYRKGQFTYEFQIN